MFKTDLLAPTLACVLLLAGTGGCTTTRPLATTSPEELATSISVEDVVQIERQSGSRLTFAMTEVSEEGVRGSGIFVPYADIGSISVVRESPLRTGLLVGLGVAVIYVLETNADCGIFDWSEDCED